MCRWIKLAAQIKALQAKDYQVLSVQIPLMSLDDNLAATRRLINLVQGKVILVGHSWGGFVITQAGNDPKVAGLVYIAAYAPDEGETVTVLSANGPVTKLGKYLIPVGRSLFLNEAGESAATFEFYRESADLKQE